MSGVWLCIFGKYGAAYRPSWARAAERNRAPETHQLPGLVEIKRHLQSGGRERESMQRISMWLSFSLCVAGLLTAIADAAQTERLIFLSTQLRPIEEAQKMRNLILKGFPGEVDYITEQPQQFPVRIKAERQGG